MSKRGTSVSRREAKNDAFQRERGRYTRTLQMVGWVRLPLPSPLRAEHFDRWGERVAICRRAISRTLQTLQGVALLHPLPVRTGNSQMPHFTRDDTIFDNEDVLRDDYQPDRLEERDEELEAYKSALQPVVNGAQPRNIFLYGKTGVGKTAASRYLLDLLQEDVSEHYEDVDLNVFSLNCNGLTSSYQVAVNLVNEMRPPGDQIAETGLPKRTVFKHLYQTLDEIGGTIMVVLDEIDNIGEDDDILYELPRARSNGHVEDAKPGIIGISNDFSFKENLSPQVEDTLCEREIHFPPYDAEELRSILSQRAGLALYDGVLDEDALSLAAAFAAQDRGSARQALDLLYEAGELARRRDAENIREAHVREARDVLEQKKIEECMEELPMHGRFVLCAVVTLTAEGDTPARRKTIWERYTELAERTNSDPLQRRSIHNHLQDLVMLGILDRFDRNQGRRGGSYYQYEMAVKTSAAVNALEDLQVQGIDIESIRAEL